MSHSTSLSPMKRCSMDLDTGWKAWNGVMSSIMAIIFHSPYDNKKKALPKRRTECQWLMTPQFPLYLSRDILPVQRVESNHGNTPLTNQVSWIAAACFCILHDARMSRHLDTEAETRPTRHYPDLCFTCQIMSNYLFPWERGSTMIAYMPYYNHMMHDHVKNDGIRYSNSSVWKQTVWGSPQYKQCTNRKASKSRLIQPLLSHV